MKVFTCTRSTMFTVLWLVVVVFVTTDASAVASWRPTMVNMDEIVAQKDGALLDLRRGLRTGAVVVTLDSGTSSAALLSAVSRCKTSNVGAGGIRSVTPNKTKTVPGKDFPTQAAATCPDLVRLAKSRRDLASVLALATAAIVDASAKEYAPTGADDVATKSVRAGMLVERFAVTTAADGRQVAQALPDVGVFKLLSASTYPSLVLRDGRIVTPEVPRGAALLLVGDAMRLISPEFRPMPFIANGLGALTSISFSIHDDFVGREPLTLEAEKPTARRLVDANEGTAMTLTTSTNENSSPSAFCDTTMMAMTMHMAGFMTVIGGHHDNCINFLFPDLTLSTPVLFAMALVASFLMGTAAEALQSYRRRFKGNTYMKALFYFLNITLGYAVMLIVMTYSVELTLAAMIGLACGHASFNIKAPLTSSVSPCCVVRIPSKDVLANRDYKVEGMMCQACAHTIKTALLGLEFVEDADVDFKQGRATVFISNAGQPTDDRLDKFVIEAVEDVGFDAEAWVGPLPYQTGYSPPAVLPSDSNPSAALL